MKKMIALGTLTSLVLSSCCMPPRMDDFARLEGTEAEPWGLCGIFSGFGTMEAPERFAAVYSPVSVSEYGDLLCGHLEPEDYATCVNRIWDYYREANRQTPPAGNSTSGPFAVVMSDEVLLGSYHSDPFSASFRVSSANLSCTGSYNAFLGSTEAVFDVRCDNGKRGKAKIVLDRSGRNGVGRVYMDDGDEGRIVFGPATVGGALKMREI